jgi:nucleoside triphosphate diphosphatase
VSDDDPETAGTPSPVRNENEGFSRLVALMHKLRAPGGCPWDAEQTHASIKHYLVEEAYETVEAIESGTDAELCGELGDVLLQVVFHSEMAAERGAFDVQAVIATLCDKLVRRHPHVFAGTKVRSADEVAENWTRIKKAERAAADRTGSESVIAGVPRALPGLLRAHRIGQKAAAAGFDWDSASGVRVKLEEELRELDEALAANDAASAGAEIGDLLFTLTSLARQIRLDSETLLNATLSRFEDRFRALEQHLAARGTSIATADPAVVASEWVAIKQRERGAA